jgi:hypothetical protein
METRGHEASDVRHVRDHDGADTLTQPMRASR